MTIGWDDSWNWNDKLVWVQHEIWKGWHQCDMVMVWDRAPYSGLENNELARFGWEYERCEQWEIVWGV